MKAYKWFRRVLIASSFTTLMFIMQACYGVPEPYDYEEITISGIVVDKDTQEPLKGVQVNCSCDNNAYSNENGEFSFSCYSEYDDTDYSLSFELEGYQTVDTVIGNALDSIRIEMVSK